MNNPLWFNAALICGLSALAVAAGQWLWATHRVRRQLQRRIEQRLSPQQELSAEHGARYLPGRLEVVMLRANLTLSPRQIALAGLAAAATIGITALSKGWITAIACSFFMVSAAYIYWRMRFQKQRQQIHSELPGLIDAVLRFIEAGRSLEQALCDAFAEASNVFDPLTFRLRSAVESGRDYTRLFEDFSELYRAPSLVLVAIALKTSSRFGSSVQPLLRQVSSALRTQQELRQEFMAATAETRFTAATFALLPPGLAVYMIAINDDYSDVLLNTATGHTMLGIAGALQLLGMIIIWRMIQGVGRE